MESVSTKKVAKEKKDCRILVIDDEIVTTRIRSLLQNSVKFQYTISCSCGISEIKQKVVSQTVDLIFFGLKSNDHRNRFIAEALKRSSSPPPVILLKGNRSSSVPSGILFQSVLVKKSLDCNSILEAIYKYAYQFAKKHSRQDCFNEPHSNDIRIFNIIRELPDGIIITNEKRKILFFNPAAVLMLFGTDEVPMPSLLPFDFITRQPCREVRLKRTGRILETRITEVSWNSDQAYLLSLHDITYHTKAEVALKQREKKYSLAMKSSRVTLWDLDLREDRLNVSDQWNQITGNKNGSLTFSLKEWYSNVHSSDVRSFKYYLKRHVDGQSKIFETECRVCHRNGSWIWISIRGEVSRNRSGQAIKATGLISEITERKKAECQLRRSFDDLKFALASEKILMEELDRKNKELTELSITDGLTGLYNHRFLQERFDFEYKRVRRYGGNLSCMMIDIDHFKSINDTYGHQFGDKVLRQLSDFLKKNSREVDICGRYGGEEFMILTNLKAGDTFKFATKLNTAIEHHEFECGTKKVHVTASIGISEYQTEIKSKQQLIERADTALYQAKTDGRNLIRVWKKVECIDDYFEKNSTEKIKNKFIDLSNQMRMTYIESTNALIKAIDAKDPFAKEHSANVSRYSVMIAKKLGLSDSEIEVIRYAALLHDIGKISVKDEILTKKTPLSSEEYAILKRHPEVGVDILKEVKFLEKEIPIILHHHERFDGRGYPYGLKGKEIPIGARIVCIADAIDAMTSGRTYRKQLSWPIAIKELERGRDRQFAPEIVDTVLDLFDNKELC